MIFRLLPFLLICSFSTHADSESILQLMNKRLSYMEDVALYKAHNHLPIENIKREKVVLDKAKHSAKDAGLAPDSIEEFFVAQISVAKAIQYRFRADLLSQPSPEKPKDLNKEIRPQLILLGDKITQNIKAYLEEHKSFNALDANIFAKNINVKYVTAHDKEMLFTAMKKITLLKENE